MRDNRGVIFIFVVIALGDPEALGKKIKERFADDDVYLIESGKWLVYANRTTACRVAKKLGMTAEENIEGLVVTIYRDDGYTGLASGDIWEWIAAKTAPSR